MYCGWPSKLPCPPPSKSPACVRRRQRGVRVEMEVSRILEECTKDYSNNNGGVDILVSQIQQFCMPPTPFDFNILPAAAPHVTYLIIINVQRPIGDPSHCVALQSPPSNACDGCELLFCLLWAEFVWGVGHGLVRISNCKISVPICLIMCHYLQYLCMYAALLILVTTMTRLRLTKNVLHSTKRLKEATFRSPSTDWIA